MIELDPIKSVDLPVPSIEGLASVDLSLVFAFRVADYEFPDEDDITHRGVVLQVDSQQPPRRSYLQVLEYEPAPATATIRLNAKPREFEALAVTMKASVYGWYMLRAAGAKAQAKT